VFYSGKTPETITISERGKKFVQANCIRCHSERVAMINQDRNCWTATGSSSTIWPASNDELKPNDRLIQEPS